MTKHENCEGCGAKLSEDEIAYNDGYMSILKLMGEWGVKNVPCRPTLVGVLTATIETINACGSPAFALELFASALKISSEHMREDEIESKKESK
tara:strand:- start:1232 stop:1513 length:282 start_codon:yes stop_codon:yes gene_type:complete